MWVHATQAGITKMAATQWKSKERREWQLEMMRAADCTAETAVLVHPWRTDYAHSQHLRRECPHCILPSPQWNTSHRSPLTEVLTTFLCFSINLLTIVTHPNCCHAPRIPRQVMQIEGAFELA